MTTTSSLYLILLFFYSGWCGNTSHTLVRSGKGLQCASNGLVGPLTRRPIQLLFQVELWLRLLRGLSRIRVSPHRFLKETKLDGGHCYLYYEDLGRAFPYILFYRSLLRIPIETPPKSCFI